MYVKDMVKTLREALSPKVPAAVPLTLSGWCFPRRRNWSLPRSAPASMGQSSRPLNCRCCVSGPDEGFFSAGVLPSELGEQRRSQQLTALNP